MQQFTIKNGLIVPRQDVLKEVLEFEIAEFKVNPTEKQAHIVKLLQAKYNQLITA